MEERLCDEDGMPAVDGVTVRVLRLMSLCFPVDRLIA